MLTMLPGEHTGHDDARFVGWPVVVVPLGGPDNATLPGEAVVDLEGSEPEMVVLVDETTIERLRREAKSSNHLRDHKPKNPFCDACQQSKMFRRPHGRIKHHGPLPTRFGESLCADHLVSHSEKSQSLLGDKSAVVAFDRYSSWKGIYPEQERRRFIHITPTLCWATNQGRKHLHGQLPGTCCCNQTGCNEAGE